MICPNCRQNIPDNVRFCTQCGEPLRPGVSSPKGRKQQNMTPRKNKSQQNDTLQSNEGTQGEVVTVTVTGSRIGRKGWEAAQARRQAALANGRVHAEETISENNTAGFSDGLSDYSLDDTSTLDNSQTLFDEDGDDILLNGGGRRTSGRSENVAEQILPIAATVVALVLVFVLGFVIARLVLKGRGDGHGVGSISSESTEEMADTHSETEEATDDGTGSNSSNASEESTGNSWQSSTDASDSSSSQTSGNTAENTADHTSGNTSENPTEDSASGYADSSETAVSPADHEQDEPAEESTDWYSDSTAASDEALAAEEAKAVADPYYIFKAEFTVDELLNATESLYDTVHSGGFEYGNSQVLPPCTDGYISGDRFIARILWDLGLHDQPVGGVTSLWTYLPRHGFDLISDPNDLQPGDIVQIMYTTANDHTRDTFILTDYDPETGMCRKYDMSKARRTSELRLHCAQPFTAALNEFGDNGEFLMGYRLKALPESSYDSGNEDIVPASTGLSVLDSRPSDLSAYTSLPYDSASATSFLIQELPEYIDNRAVSAIDGDETTSWQEGASGYGAGEAISTAFVRHRRVKYIALQLGNWRTGQSYYDSGRPRTMTITVGGRDFRVDFSDTRSAKYLAFSEPVYVDRITYTIEDTYDGVVYPDCCISEIKAYGE